MGDDLVIDADARTITVAGGEPREFSFAVPAVFGDLQSAERRGEFIVVFTDGGRVAYHADTPRRVSDQSWQREHSLRGKIHWHSLRKALDTHCLRSDLRKRVAFHITHSRYPSGARSGAGGGGWVSVDGQKVLQCSDSPKHDYTPAELGAALAEYLHLEPIAARDSDNMVIAALSLLDRRLSDEAFAACARDRFQHRLWASFHDLRSSTGNTSD